MRAIVCTYLPDEDKVYHQNFEGEGCVERAQAFRKGEQKQGDFPGSLWGIIADSEAREDNGNRLVARLTGEPV